jgi:DNA topoisomerase-1
VRNGKYGPYVKRGDDTASIPEDLPFDELTVERAVELLEAPKGDTPLGTDPESGLPVYAKNGRFGPYVQLGDADTLPDGEKPKMASLFSTMSLATLQLDDAVRLLSLPRVVGVDPSDGEEITAQNGRYGPYIKKGNDSRSLSTEDELFTLTLERALAILAEPKTYGRRSAAPKPPLKEFAADPVSGNPIQLKDGRYGPYVTDGVDNQSLKKGDTVEDLTYERAVELLAERRDYLANNPQAARKKAKKAAKKTTAKKTAKKSAKKSASP